MVSSVVEAIPTTNPAGKNALVSEGYLYVAGGG